MMRERKQKTLTTTLTSPLGLSLVLLSWVVLSSIESHDLFASRQDSHQKLLQQVDQAIENFDWRQAQSLLKKIPNTADEQDPEVDKRRQWCLANRAVEDRYLDRSITDTMAYMQPHTAMMQLEEVLELADEQYFQNFDQTTLFKKGLLQCLAATQNPAMQKALDTTPEKLYELQNKLVSLYNTFEFTSSDTINEIKQTLKTLYALSEKAGLNPCWPTIELSYAYADSLDKYSYLISPQKYRIMQDRLKGNYVGIGIDVLSGEEFPIIFDVIPNSPADKAGIQPGDAIIKVKNKHLKNLPMSKVGSLLTGKPNTLCQLSLKRDNDIFEVQVKRSRIDSPTVRNLKYISEYTTGYFRVAGFDNDTEIEMNQAIKTLTQQGAKSLIIDLRSNGGGKMDSAINAASLFIQDGVIVKVQTADNKIIHRTNKTSSKTYAHPVVLLVDEHTASAAEIFSAALKDHQRATVIGSKTLGKGLVQTIYHLKYTNAALSLTTASFTPPSDISFHRKGVIPNIIIDANNTMFTKLISTKNYSSNDDLHFHTALQCLISKKESVKTLISSKNL